MDLTGSDIITSDCRSIYISLSDDAVCTRLYAVPGAEYCFTTSNLNRRRITYISLI